MRILEIYNEPKISRDVIEDFTVVTEDFIAVIDGATDKTGHKIEGVYGGRFVADLVAAETEQLPVDASFEEWVSKITDAINRGLDRAGWPSNLPRPCACSVTYSRYHGEIWRVGDSGYRIDGFDFIGGKLIDDEISGQRAHILKTALGIGVPVNELLDNDIGREAVLPLLRTQFEHANNDSSEFGYPVFDGRPIPPSLLERPFKVPPGARVVLFSDGLDFPADTLSETLARQQASYDLDPLRIGLDEAKASTKGLRGQVRHDDQTYISFISGS